MKFIKNGILALYIRRLVWEYENEEQVEKVFKWTAAVIATLLATIIIYLNVSRGTL